MNYATRDDLAAIGLSSKALAGIDATRQIKALEIASSSVAGYLNRRFTLPLILWGADITRAVCILAAYDLRVSSGFNPQPGSADEELRLRVEEVTRWLELIARGTVVPFGITDSSVNPAPSAGGGSSAAESQRPRGWSDGGGYGYGNADDD